MLYRYPTSDYPHPQPALCGDQTIQMLQSKTIASDCTGLSGLLASTDGNWILYLWTRISFFHKIQNWELQTQVPTFDINFPQSYTVIIHYSHLPDQIIIPFAALVYISRFMVLEMIESLVAAFFPRISFNSVISHKIRPENLIKKDQNSILRLSAPRWQ